MRTFLAAVFCLLLAGPSLAWEHDLPDPKLTPGAVNVVRYEQEIGIETRRPGAVQAVH